MVLPMSCVPISRSGNELAGCGATGVEWPATLTGRGTHVVSNTAIELDAETLRRCLRIGGLEVSAERAAALLPTVAALLAACERVAALELSCQGGSAPSGASGD
jgi:hypothetical protein